MNDWIEWVSWAYPVPNAAVVDVKFRDGSVDECRPAGEFSWRIDPSKAPNGFDIIAYRLHKPEPKYGEWISAEDALPDDVSGYRVLVTANDIVSEWIQVLNYNGTDWVHNGGEVFPPIVTHWTPLPPKPNSN